LFIERAAVMQPQFSLTDQNANAVMQICRRLSGMPLAIELAASRIKMMKVDEIATRLDDRFSLLTSGNRSALPRQQTLRATIDWSHDLLTEPERILFRRLSVFAGGFTLDAAESICGQDELKRNDVLDLLGRLVDKSLVNVESASEKDETRYRLLETIRQYALEKLTEIGEEAQEIRDRHSEFFVNWVEAVEPNIFGSDSAIWFKRLDKEFDNIRAAMDWSTNYGNAVNTLRIAGAIANFWFVFTLSLSHSEWHSRVRQALARPEGLERTVARAKALNGIGFLLWVEMYPIDIRLELEEALAIAREHGDNWNVAAALRNLGLFAGVRGTFVEARTFFLQSLEAWREMVPADKMEIGRTLMFLGDAALTHHETEQARSLFEESIEIWRDFGDQSLMAYSVRRLGQLALRGGDSIGALRLCKESLNLNHNTGDIRGVLACVAELGTISAARGNSERAITLMAAVESQLAQTGIRLLPVDKTEYERNLALLRAKLDGTAFEKAWAEGRAMTLEQAIQYALEKSDG
jgi:non-specific serine/threonine protein kinase